MWPKTTTYLRIWPNYGWPNRCAKSPIHWSIGSRKKPRLGDDAASQTRLLIDDVLDTLE